MKRKKGYYSISAVAKIFSVHQQTIRLYEREGLICPKRSGGNTRIFSEEDVDKLEQIIYLTHELGVNLAGVEMVLKLQKQINKLQKEMNKAFQETHDNLTKEGEMYKTSAQESAQKLVTLKHKKKVMSLPKPEAESLNDEAESVKSDDQWLIDYEE